MDLIYKIHNIIKKYYLLGFKSNSSIYLDYIGFKELKKLYQGKVESEKYEKWNTFLNKNSRLNQKGVNTTMLFSNCYSGFIEIETIETNDFKLKKLIHIELSVLGEFYTIYGRDIITYKKEKLTFPYIITVSPEGKYEEPMRKIIQNINIEYPNYELIPFRLLRIKIEGLFLNFLPEEQNGNIYQALFSHNDICNNKLKGELSFGLGDKN